MAISNNGTIEVSFYKEETYNLNIWTGPTWRYYPKYYEWGTIKYDMFTPIIGTTTGDIYTTNSISYAPNNKTFTSNSLSSNTLPNNIETGRVEKGENSDQEFDGVNMEFERYKICSVSYQILPESQKPIETKEIYKEKTQPKFCENCGNKLKGSENFCPECGKKIK
jgi:hypothetical protein